MSQAPNNSINSTNRFLDNLCFEESMIYQFLFSEKSATSFISDVLSDCKNDVERVITLEQLRSLLNENSQDRIIEFFYQNDLNFIPIQPNKYLISSFTIEEEEAHNHELMLKALAKKGTELTKLKDDLIPRLIKSYTNGNKNSVVKGLNYVGKRRNLLKFKDYLIENELIDKIDDETFCNVFSKEFVPNGTRIHWKQKIKAFRFFISVIKHEDRCNPQHGITNSFEFMFTYTNQRTGEVVPITKEIYGNNKEPFSKNFGTIIKESIRLLTVYE